MFKVLLREGMADANATDNENSTPLHAASQEGKLNVVKILVGLKKNLKDGAFENIIDTLKSRECSLKLPIRQ